MSKVTNMGGMFYNCLIDNPVINAWNVLNVTNMNYMFFSCKKLKNPPRWIINEGTNTSHIFENTRFKDYQLQIVQYNIKKQGRKEQERKEQERKEQERKKDNTEMQKKNVNKVYNANRNY